MSWWHTGRLVYLAVDDAHARRKLHGVLRDAAGCTLALRTLDDAVDLLLGEVVGHPVTYIVCDHRSTMDAGLGVVVGVAGEGAEALPAEVVAALSACGLSVLRLTIIQMLPPSQTEIRPLKTTSKNK
jgi:hypothetical protein